MYARMMCTESGQDPPKLSLVVLIGVSGSGKSTFARANFRPTEVLSSDFCKALRVVRKFALGFAVLARESDPFDPRL